MPQYTDCLGFTYDLEDWDERSFKGAVINQAHRNRAFIVIQWPVMNVLGFQGNFFQTLYSCSWCHRLIPSCGVAGDHLVGRVVGRSTNKETQSLFEDAQGNGWNLVLACNECNSGSRNKGGVMTRGDYKTDREFHDPKPPKGGGGGGGGGKPIPAIVIR